MLLRSCFLLQWLQMSHGSNSVVKRAARPIRQFAVSDSAIGGSCDPRPAGKSAVDRIGPPFYGRITFSNLKNPSPPGSSAWSSSASAPCKSCGSGWRSLKNSTMWNPHLLT